MHGHMNVKKKNSHMLVSLQSILSTWQQYSHIWPRNQEFSKVSLPDSATNAICYHCLVCAHIIIYTDWNHYVCKSQHFHVTIPTNIRTGKGMYILNFQDF